MKSVCLLSIKGAKATSQTWAVRRCGVSTVCTSGAVLSFRGVADRSGARVGDSGREDGTGKVGPDGDRYPCVQIEPQSQRDGA